MNYIITGILPGYFSDNVKNQSNLPDRGCVHMSLHEKNNQCIHLANCSVYEKCNTLCFVAFFEKNGTVHPILSGCGDFCNAETQCPVQNYEKDNKFLCCCNGHLCNRNMVFNHSLVHFTSSVPLPPSNMFKNYAILCYTLSFFLFFCFVLSLLIFYFNYSIGINLSKG